MIRTRIQPLVAVAVSLGVFAFLMLPFVVFGAVTDNPRDLGQLGESIIAIINSVVVPLILAIAFLYFIWGVFRYFIASNEETKEKGRDLMFYGLIGFFVIISVWGIINLLTDTIKLDDQPEFNLPQAKERGS